MTAQSQNTGLLGSVVAWLQHPFNNTNGTATNWLYALILIAIVVWFWNHILLQVGGEISL
jgi:hypothetical protein